MHRNKLDKAKEVNGVPWIDIRSKRVGASKCSVKIIESDGKHF